MPQPRESDLPDMKSALQTAQTHRPEIHEAINNLQNQDIAIAIRRTINCQSLSVFGLAAGSGLEGNTLLATSRRGGSLGQTFSAQYPEGAFGASFSATIRNRSAQADSARAQLERNQMQVGLQNTRNQMWCRCSRRGSGSFRAKSQVEAAQEAVRLAQLTLDGERKKLEVGISTSYNVVLRERDLVSAQYAEVQALDAYVEGAGGARPVDRNHARSQRDSTERRAQPARSPKSPRRRFHLDSPHLRRERNR